MLAPLQTVPVVGMELEAFVVLFIAALAGGAFGAAIGALPSFVFTGFVVFLGEGIAILERQLGDVSAVPAGDIATGITGVIGFGAVTGPHVAFAGGVAASAYAGKRYPEMEPDGWDFHFGKDILYAFGTKPDVLAVGALFGALGMVIARVSGGLGVPTDGIALSVVATALIARVAFGYALLGSPAGTGRLDMSPFERGEQDESGLVTEPWLPHQYRWAGVTAIGLVGGVLGGYIWLETGSVFMGYAISAMSLLFLQLGVDNIPVTHHITLLGAVGAVVAASLVSSDAVALVSAGALGAVSGLVGELAQRVLYAHGDTHVDPPAVAIAVLMLGVGLLSLLGVLPTSAYLSL